MIIFDREELVSKKGNVNVPNVFVSKYEILNYELIVDAIIELCISFKKNENEDIYNE